MSGTRTRVLHWFVSGGVAKTPDGGVFTIDVEPLLVGRDPAAGILILDPEVSALHCELRAVGEGILVKDLGSTNGTFIGVVRIKEAIVAGPVELSVGRSRVYVEPQAKRRVDVGYAARFGPLVGSSPRMRRVFSILEKVADTPLNVLVVGEAGTGKDLVARALHDASRRKEGPFVVVDCGGIPDSLGDAFLFGQAGDPQTPGSDDRKGALLEATGGTLFLDELGELPYGLQAKLMRALADKHVKRSSESAAEPVDVRVVASTRRDLGAEINAGRFRSDLFFRIAQVRVELPPLRERLSDLPLLVEEACRQAGRAAHAQAVLSWLEQRMASHDWPGNVRELMNIAGVAATLADEPGAIDDVLTLTRSGAAGDAPPKEGATGAAGTFGEDKRAAMAVFEREYFTALARRCKGNVSEMARQAGMERHHVRAYLRKHAIAKTVV